MKTWFRFENAAAEPQVVDIHIIDFIGDWTDDAINRFWGENIGVTARAFVEQLAKIDDAVTTIRVHINSPGGDVFAAANIANALRDQQRTKGRTVETIIDGLAASAASVIAMAGSTVRMADNALLMIHDPWSYAIGNAAAMRKMADDLDKVRDTIVATYKWHSGLDDAEIVALMAAETWMDAAEAKARGFVTETIEGLKAAASINPKAIASLKVPDQYRARLAALVRAEAEEKQDQVEPDADGNCPDGYEKGEDGMCHLASAQARLKATPAAAAALEVIRLCNAAGVPEMAEALVTEGVTLAQATAKTTAAKAEREARVKREGDIRAICALAKLDDRAPLYIKSGLALEEIKADIAKLSAQLDRTEINSSLDPDRGESVAASWKHVFARLQGRRRAKE